jgi:hypothetical protein
MKEQWRRSQYISTLKTQAQGDLPDNHVDSAHNLQEHLIASFRVHKGMCNRKSTQKREGLSFKLGTHYSGAPLATSQFVHQKSLPKYCATLLETSGRSHDFIKDFVSIFSGNLRYLFRSTCSTKRPSLHFDLRDMAP